ncbi:MAG TPA: hypothetical protein VFZ78_11330 [Flavisolibacter sp.]
MTPEEEKFIQFWAVERTRKKRFLRRFSIGLPLGVFIAVAILVNVMSGWYTKAEMALRASTSLLLVILVAVIAIVVFMTVFSAHHKWDRNEGNYQDLLKKKQREDQLQA